MARQKSSLTSAEQDAMRMLEEYKQHWRDRVIFDCKLSGMTKAVAYAMAIWITATETREAFLRNGDVTIRGRQRALAEMVGCSAKTVHLAMASLMEHSHITLVRRPQGRDDTNLYRINPRPAALDVRSARKLPANFRPPAAADVMAQRF